LSTCCFCDSLQIFLLATTNSHCTGFNKVFHTKVIYKDRECYEMWWAASSFPFITNSFGCQNDICSSGKNHLDTFSNNIRFSIEQWKIEMRVFFLSPVSSCFLHRTFV
jgi:hypothetical protein